MSTRYFRLFCVEITECYIEMHSAGYIIIDIYSAGYIIIDIHSAGYIITVWKERVGKHIYLCNLNMQTVRRNFMPE